MKIIMAAPDGLACSRSAITIHFDNPYFISAAKHAKTLQHIYNHPNKFQTQKTRTRRNAIVASSFGHFTTNFIITVLY